jgi:AcrR family transcriptional regulator
VNERARSYVSPRRAQNAGRTRDDILDAARELFLAHGYSQVTVSDIARLAGVAAKTVYASVGAKPDVLQEVLLSDVAESAAAHTLESVRRAPDLWSAVAAIAAGTRSDSERFARSIELMDASKYSDEGARRIWEQVVGEFRAAMRSAAEHLVGSGLACRELDEAAVADRLWLCFGFAAWRSLISDCGWSFDDAERLLAQSCLHMLGGGRTGAAQRT